MDIRYAGKFVLIMLALLTLPAIASGQQPEQDVEKAWTSSASLYEKLVAKGIQDYAEGRYERAVDSLQRAYARGGAASTLKLVIRAYDEMGHCDAAARQRAFFSDVHANDRPPAPNRCENATEITLVCQPVGTPVRIDRVMSSACGQSITLPVGAHLFATVNQREFMVYEVAAGEDTLVLDSMGEGAQRGYAAGSARDVESTGRPRPGRERAGASRGGQQVGLVGADARGSQARLICSGGSFGPSEDCISVGDNEVADVSEFSRPLLYIESPRESESYVPTICYDEADASELATRDDRECVTVEKHAETKTCCSVERVD